MQSLGREPQGPDGAYSGPVSNLTVRLPRDYHDRLKATAKAQGYRTSDYYIAVLDEFIRNGLQRHPPLRGDQRRRTGLHLRAVRSYRARARQGAQPAGGRERVDLHRHRTPSRRRSGGLRPTSPPGPALAPAPVINTFMSGEGAGRRRMSEAWRFHDPGLCAIGSAPLQQDQGEDPAA